MFNRVPFSKRRKQAAEVGKPLVYEYDLVPQTLRNQVILILRRALGTQVLNRSSFIRGNEPSAALEMWSLIFQQLTDERGEFKLDEQGETSDIQVCNYLLNCDCDGFIDGVEAAPFRRYRQAK